MVKMPTIKFAALFRSEKMRHCQIVLHTESAFECLLQLGYMGVVQFIEPEALAEDDTPSRYKLDIFRCNEILRYVKHLEYEVHETEMRSVFFPDTDLDDVPHIKDLQSMESKVHKLSNDLTELDRNISALKSREAHLKEVYYVLSHVQDVLKGQHNTERIMAWSDSVVMNLIRDETNPYIERSRANEQKLRFYAGTIPVEMFKSFEILLYRCCHHNFYIHKENIPEALNDAHGIPRRKLAFMVVYVGERVGHIVAKICMGMRVKAVPVAVTNSERQATMEEVQKALVDLKNVCQRAYFERTQILAVASGDIFVWKVKILKMLAIFTQLNKMTTLDDVNQQYLSCNCWIPDRDINKVKKALLRGARRAGLGDIGMMFPPTLVLLKNQKTAEDPPSLFVLNKFTKPFQALIDAYGLPNYQELNPSPYTVVTFPFLFAIMFGDVGHGLLITVFAYWMVANEEKFEKAKKKTKNVNEIYDVMFTGRYIILMMGLFSIYTGLMYNDIFSKSVNLFGSRWHVDTNETVVTDEHLRYLELNPSSRRQYLGEPYIFGLDPVWSMSESAILFLNSYKMKVSIIIGFIHMIFGLILSASNCIFFRSVVDLYFVVFPQLLFLVCIFGGLILMIIVKWCTFGGYYPTPYNSACAPAVLLSFINMLMFKDNPKPPRGCEPEMFTGQTTLQLFFLIVALICIPVLFCGKPIYYWRKNKELKKEYDELKRIRIGRRKEQQEKNEGVNPTPTPTLTPTLKPTVSMNIEPEYHDMGEIWMHSSIHGVEYLLGSISHTASYLRLWALSLAHQQLSHVLWLFLFTKPLKMGMSIGVGSAIMVFAFLIWAAFTVAVMVIMEGLSAFLHTLRLHWVEFQSKFYTGTGERFSPFKFHDAAKVELL